MSLPPCHSRRAIEGESILYYCAHPRMHVRDQVVRAEICKICPYWQQPPPAVFRPFPPPPSWRKPGPCRHLGEPVGNRACRSCGGKVRLKVFGCAHPRHGETTLAECRKCGDFEPMQVDGSARGENAAVGTG